MVHPKFRYKHSWSLIVFTVLIVSSLLLLPAHILITNYKKAMIKEMSKRALAVAVTTATLLEMNSTPYIELTRAILEDPKSIDQLYYDSMHTLFIKIRQNAKMDYLYTQYESDKSSTSIILDVQEDKSSPYSFSPGFQEPMKTSGCEEAYQYATTLCTGFIEHERWGASIFAHAPILDNTDKRVIGIVSTGFTIAHLKETIRSMFFLILGMFILIIILVSLAICILLRSREHSLDVEYLTQLGTKHFFESQLARVIAQAKASKIPFSLLLLDVDGFKQINDTYGHLTGDRVLQTVATIIRSKVQSSDFCSRIGGDEFAVILTTSVLEQALLTAQTIQNTIKDYTTEDNPDLELSVSIGVAQWDERQNTPELFEQADQALYKAKESGKDTVIH